MPTKKSTSNKRAGPKTKASQKLAKSPQARKKVKKVMHEYKEGTLRSGRSRKKVTSRKQAIAIALSEAGASDKEKDKRK